jgi:3-oxoacyl-[acyl-carrier protein] reductase
MRTEILASMKPEALAKTAALVPAGRLGEPHEVAHTLLYILENDYLNGRIVELDGGLRL